MTRRHAQASHQLVIATRGRGFYEFTNEVAKRLREAALTTGLATVFVQHTSASLLIQENADPEVRRDFERFFARLVPDGDALFATPRRETMICRRTFAPR